jgi:hypothetical protein
MGDVRRTIDCHTHLMWHSDRPSGYRAEFPSAKMDNIVAGLRNVKRARVQGTHLPTIPVEVQDAIQQENRKVPFSHWS